MRENNFQGELPAFFDKLRTEDRDKYYGKSAVSILYMISYNNSIKTNSVDNDFLIYMFFFRIGL